MTAPDLRGALMVCGTTSNAGKSTLVAGLCRVLARRGVAVAPFKAQNMALNSAVTATGHEIGRAQAHQAFAAGVEPEVAMNPVLLKPTGERASEVIVMGRSQGLMTALDYHGGKPDLLDLVLDALDDLRRRYDVVLLEGAGSPTEINLLDRDIVNLRLAHRAGVPAVVVGDIDLGGVFAALYGTVALLPDDLRPLVRGFIVNKLRGDPALLGDGFDELERRCGVPTLGVVPWLGGLDFDAEDSLALDARRAHRDRVLTGEASGDLLDVAVVRFPRLANAGDLDPLDLEPGVHVRFIRDAAELGHPDLVILPGTHTAVADLAWLRRCGLADALAHCDTTILGVGGGYQLLGETIVDDTEAPGRRVAGLGLLPVTTHLRARRLTRRCRGEALGQPVDGYQIDAGSTSVHGGDPFVWLHDTAQPGTPAAACAPTIDGVRQGRVHGTTLHGLLEADGFRTAFLTDVATHAAKRFTPGETSVAAARHAQVDRLADALDAHIDLARIDELIGQARPAGPART